MCLLQHNGNGNADFVFFIAASRTDQVSVESCLSEPFTLKLLPLPHDIYMLLTSTHVYLCVRTPYLSYSIETVCHKTTREGFFCFCLTVFFNVIL